MARSVASWVGATDDAVPPPRVRLRVFDAHGGRCHLCGRKISASEYWQLDHVVALINGGANAESNLKPACRNCCYAKTAEDVAEKSRIARKREKHLGIKPKSRGFNRPAGAKFNWTTGRYDLQTHLPAISAGSPEPKENDR